MSKSIHGGILGTRIVVLLVTISGAIGVVAGAGPALGPVNVADGKTNFGGMVHDVDGYDLGLKRATVVVPAGSVNALSAAIVSAGARGTVRVASGVHFESGTVEVASEVSIIGDPGAVIESGTMVAAIYPVLVDPTFRVHDTSRVTIQGLEMRPPAGGTAGCAVLIENADDVKVIGNNIHDYQFGVLVQYGDRADIRGNSISLTTRWTLDPSDPEFLPEAHGIVVINGTAAHLTGNTVSNALFNIWACGAKGQAKGNTVTGGLIGLILCNVPGGGFLISGSSQGSEVPGTGWHVEDNLARFNLWGYLVIDQANNNYMNNNAASDNALYDIELTADTYRFGFLTPASYSNVVAQGSHKGLVVKDCGNDNVVSGDFTLVDTTVDPCN
jgi:hypothetical protein